MYTKTNMSLDTSSNVKRDTKILSTCYEILNNINSISYDALIPESSRKKIFMSFLESDALEKIPNVAGELFKMMKGESEIVSRNVNNNHTFENGNIFLFSIGEIKVMFMLYMDDEIVYYHRDYGMGNSEVQFYNILNKMMRSGSLVATFRPFEGYPDRDDYMRVLWSTLCDKYLSIEDIRKISDLVSTLSRECRAYYIVSV